MPYQTCNECGMGMTGHCTEYRANTDGPPQPACGIGREIIRLRAELAAIKGDRQLTHHQQLCVEAEEKKNAAQ